MFLAGDIVLPLSPGSMETIIGIVTGSMGANREVVWFSDRRGVFLCWEHVHDLSRARLAGRDEITDPKLDHMSVVSALREAWGKGRE